MEEIKVEKFKVGNSCHGDIFEINDIDYDNLDKLEVINFINDMILKDINKEQLIKNIFKLTLEYLQLDVIDSHSSTCEQCGNDNWIVVYGKE